MAALCASTASLHLGRREEGRVRVCYVMAAKQSSEKGTKRVKVVEEGDKSASLREKTTQVKQVKLLTKIEQLKLLSKVEKAGLLSAAENLGITLSSIESSGLLSKAEELGLLSAATDPSVPGTLSTTSLALFAAAPFVVAAVCVIGGSAAFGASSFVSTLQQS